jgi:cell division protease FtsH
MSEDGPSQELAARDQSSGAAQPPEHKSRERDEDRTTRKPLAWWDRVKIEFLLLLLFGAFVWAEMANNPILPFNDSLNLTLRSKWWVLVLAVAELLRQIHYFISERRAGYHRFWTERVFGGTNRTMGRMNDWNRFRLSRALKWLVFLAILSIILGGILHESPVVALFSLPSRLLQYSPMIFYGVFIVSISILQFAAIFWFLSRGGVEVHMPEDIKTRFSDVWGQDAVLARIQENMIFLEDPESIEKRGGYVPGGILLWGPPGTGKTLMAQAVAGETSKPFVFVEPSAFINMFIGVGPLKVKALFRKLRKLALRYGGVIAFFDEADSLGSRGAVSGGSNAAESPWTTSPACNGLGYVSRESAAYIFQGSLPSVIAEERPGRISRIFVGAGMGGGGGMGTLQVLLTELSGLKKPRGFFNRHVRRALGMRPKPPPNYRILVMMATNMPQSLDEALLRPGRIDRIYKVAYPSKDGRKRTFEGYLEKVKHELTPEKIEKLAVISPYGTGATIKDMVNEALVIAIRDGRESITWEDIIKAKHLKEHGLPDDSEYILRERHAVAVHEACHAVAAYRLRHHELIDMATIERRGSTGGFVSFIPPEDIFVNWKSEYEVDIMVSLASLAGERMFFDEDHSAGVAGDLRNATMVATRMEAFVGMGSTIGSHSVTKAGILTRSQYNAEDGTDRNLFETDLGRQVETRLEDLYQRTRALLEENRREILAVAHALEARKTISGDDVIAIIEGTEGPLVDGQEYADREFEDLLGRYHEEAVAAHKAHGTVKVPLPQLGPGSTPGGGDGEVAAAQRAGNGEVKVEESSPNGPSGQKRGSEETVEVGVGDVPDPDPDEEKS